MKALSDAPIRLIIVNQFFYPDYSATSLLMTELAESLVKRGIPVTVVAGKGVYRGGERLRAFENHKGVEIERCWATSFGKGSPIGRLTDYLSFYIGAGWKLLWIKRHEVIMTLTTPPLIGVISLVIGRIRGIRIIALEQDLYPDVAIALGALRPQSLSTRFLLFISANLLRRVDRIIVLSSCMRERVLAKIGKHGQGSIDVIPNWADGNVIMPGSRNNWFCTKYDLSDLFVVLFAGNFGLVNDFSTVLDAARLLKEHRHILFLFVGGGAKEDEIRSVQLAHDLQNVRILPYHSPSNMGDILATAHVSLVTLANGLAGLSVPSKTYWVLAAGRPVLFVGDLRSEIARVIVDNKCGAAVNSGNSKDLADIIATWASNADKLAELGQAARTTFEHRFDRQRAVASYVESFRRALGRCDASTPNDALRSTDQKTLKAHTSQ